MVASPIDSLGLPSYSLLRSLCFILSFGIISPGNSQRHFRTKILLFSGVQPSAPDSDSGELEQVRAGLSFQCGTGYQGLSQSLVIVRREAYYIPEH